MNKKVIGIVAAAIVLILAIVIAVFALKGKEQGEVDNTNNPQMTTDDIINTVKEDLPDKTEEEIKDKLQTEVNDEKKDAYSDAISIIAVPEVDKSAGITVDEDGTAHYKDTNGNDVSVEIDQSIKDKTDEELEEDFDEIMNKLNEITNQAKEENKLDPSDVPETLDPSTAEKENQQANQGKTEQEIQDEIKKQQEELDKIAAEDVIGDDYYIPPEQRGDVNDPDFIKDATNAIGGDLSGWHAGSWDDIYGN